MDIKTPLRTRIRISDGNGWAAGVEGIYMGYNANYDTVKVGFVDADGNYTGDHTRVSRSAATVVEKAPAPKVLPAKTPTTATVVEKAPAPKVLPAKTPTTATVVEKAPAQKVLPAKTPTTAITRALKSVGLIPGKDFRVTGHRENGERKYTFAYVLTLDAGRVIAEHADVIESASAAAGFPFTVSVRYFGGNCADRPSVSVDNSGRSRVREEKPITEAAPAPTGNVTITLPAEYAAQAVADLKALRATHPDLSTPAMHVVKVRLDTALADASPSPVPVGGGALTGDVTDPCETQDAPAAMAIVTRVDDLDPEARYALWVCDAETRRPGVLHNACYGHSIHVAGTGAEICGPLGAYLHAYAERID
jgi:hypothetical protein